ncbi:MAG: tetratricopeptide repeat protein [Flavobacteriaceae bacterium]|nr:tetratricopeptide repeat protein [Flavobacteriaceae bacterium]
MYQKVALFRGIQLYNEDKLDEAKVYFDMAIAEPRDPEITARSTYWKAEVDYQLANYNDALVGFTLFENMNDIASLSENDQVNYNLGYVNFKLKDYDEAGKKFRNFINSNPSDEGLLSDSQVRLGDTYFVNSKYQSAIAEYNKVINSKGQAIDYAHFQRAMSYGLTGRNEDKIIDLTKFLSTYRGSSLRDDAYYELGEAYTRANQTDEAIEAYTNLMKYYKRSSYVPKALLKQGLIFYNTEQDNQALEKYRQVVKEYPNTDEAKQAVANARQVYVDLGRVDEYADWVKDIDFVEVSASDLDNDMYESAEKQYLQNNRSKAISAFRKYIERFPNGAHALNANFYLAETLFAENQKAASLKHFQFIIDQERNEFTERALTKVAQVYLDDENWKSALPILERLEEQADFAQNITFAQSNLMKGHYELEHYQDAVAYAEKVLQRPKLEKRIRSDAKIIIARSALKTGDESKAEQAYSEVEKIASGELMAEALYYNAYFKNQEGNYKVSNTVVQKLVSDYASYKYYGAKGLIVMAKNYYELDDAFQATYILESVIKNFSDYDDVVQEAKDELSRIKTEESKTNESVNPDRN